ncbi:selenocysteine-specific translation elongation factor [Bacillus timonensis]|nr:selenocysteine-specific translation elongation factor [Bacillus timonensis]
MGKQTFTIGMAGHIDHGKTSLTKALTNIDTDRLKEEKERQISIELGFAPLPLNDQLQVSIIDVPGHERFIRQMIAGVAGIDLVILVVAADEGIMPQTKEHLEILSFLGIQHGIVAITKMDKVEDDFIELVEEEIKEELINTVFESSPIIMVDSLSKKGIEDLKQIIIKELNKVDARSFNGSFRLPIDQVFTVKGQGTVVRGTIYEGKVSEGDIINILPSGTSIKARKLQVHNQEVLEAKAGQRVAINIPNVTKHEVSRGDVLVSSNTYVVSSTIDVCIKFVNNLKYVLKQRSAVKLHIGTSEVIGKIVFFDRNDVMNEEKEVLCQIRLDEPIVTKRNDRFVIRRPTPIETIAGGWVIDPNGKKYKFGLPTIQYLESKKKGSPTERVIHALKGEKVLSVKEIMKHASLTEVETLHTLSEPYFLNIKKEFYTLKEIFEEVSTHLVNEIKDFHVRFPLRVGVNRAEVIQLFSKQYSKQLVEYVVDDLLSSKSIMTKEQYLYHSTFTPSFPKSWEKRINQLLQSMYEDKLEAKTWNDYVLKAGLPESEANDLRFFLLSSKQAHVLDEKTLLLDTTIIEVTQRLKEGTKEEFDLKEAKEILQTSRKYLVPLLELLDQQKCTKRVENKRVWINE